MLSYNPFEQRPLAGSVFVTALDPLRRAPQLHCRSLDRLHLAAMEEMGLHRLMIHGAKQSKTAKALVFEMMTPV